MGRDGDKASGAPFHFSRYSSELFELIETIINYTLSRKIRWSIKTIPFLMVNFLSAVGLCQKMLSARCPYPSESILFGVWLSKCHLIMAERYLGYHAEMVHLDIHFRFGHDSFHLKWKKRKSEILIAYAEAHQHLLAASGWKVFKGRWICVCVLSLCLCFQYDRKGAAAVCAICSENSALCLAPWEFTQSALQEGIWHFMMIFKCKLNTGTGGINGKLENRLRIWSDFGSQGDPVCF